MNRKNKNIFFIAGLVLLLLASPLFFFHIKSYYLAEKDRLEKEINDVFDKTVEKDMDIRRKVLTGSIYFGSTQSPIHKDSTIMITEEGTKTIERKKNTNMAEQLQASIQGFLYYKNPAKAEVLDSLFQAGLKRKNIDIPTAIMVIDHPKDSFSYSTPDISGLTPIQAEPLSFDFNKEQSFQAFTDISVGFILGRMPAYYWYTAGGWLLLVIGLGIFIPYHHKQTQIRISQHLAKQVIEASQALSEKTESILQEQKTDIQPKDSEPAQPEPAEEPDSSETIIKEPADNTKIMLNQRLAFYPQFKRLVYNEESITLTHQSAKAFQALIDAPDYSVSTETFSQIVWGKDDISQDVIRQCIFRLKKDLNAIPGLNIINLRGDGYQLDIQSE